MEKKDNTVKKVSMMMMIMLAGKVLGLIRDMLQGRVFGTSTQEAIAFTTASIVPKYFLDFMFASAISASFVPIFLKYYKKDGREEAFKLAHIFISWIFLLTTVFTVICILLSTPIAVLFSRDNGLETVVLTSKLLKIMFPIIIFSGIAYSLTGVLQAMGEFNIPAAMSILSNGIIIVYFLFFIEKYGVFGLAVTFLIGWASQAVIQIPFLIKNKFSFRLNFSRAHKGMKEIITLMAPVMVSTWVTPVNFFVNTISAAAAFGGTGEGKPALSFANTLYSVITGVFVLSVSNVIFTKLSNEIADNDDSAFSNTLSSSVRILFFILIPMSLGLMALSQPIVKLIYEKDAFTEFSTLITSKALFYFSVGIVGFGLQTILSRGFYAKNEGKTPLITGIIGMMVNFALSFSLVNFMDIGGPALASSVSITVTAVIMLFTMGKKTDILSFKLLADFIKMLALGLVMFACVKLVNSSVSAVLPGSKIYLLVNLTASVVTGVAVYFAGALLLKLDEAKTTVGMVKRILRRT